MPVSREKRSPAQLREHYEIEKELANRLRGADRQVRGKLYGEVYNELFDRVPHHPQWTKQTDPDRRQQDIAAQIRLFRRFLTPKSTFLELGGGDCALSKTVAPLVARSYGCDVAEQLSRSNPAPESFRFILSDGCRLPLPDNHVDFAYSYQLMEHIHPEDARDQLQEVFRVLKPGGIYLCITPNRLSGPHDISRYYDEEATGLHLREYSGRELIAMMRSAGFSRIWVEGHWKEKHLRLPMAGLVGLEATLEALPFPVRSRISRSRIGNRLLGGLVFSQK